MSDDFISRLARMPRSRSRKRGSRGRSLWAQTQASLRERRRRGGGVSGVGDEEMDCWEDVGMKAGTGFFGSRVESPSGVGKLNISCVDCQDTPCHRHTFPFMSLPTEIRLQIYRLALARDTPVQLHITKPKVIKQEEALEEDTFHCTRSATQRAHGRRVLSQAEHPRACNTGVDRRGPPPHKDPLATTVLLLSKQVHSEARPVLYSENTFVLQLDSAVYTLTKLRQQSRSLIKHVSLTVPSHHHVLEGFADLVRLGLRYCWGLQTFTIALPTFLPRDREMGSGGTNVYANAFHILRWLPQGTKVVLDGGATQDIRQVVEENRRMAKDLDNVSLLFCPCPYVCEGCIC